MLVKQTNMASKQRKHSKREAVESFESSEPTTKLGHDEIIDGSYHRKCECKDCHRRYGDWCKKTPEHHGKPKCCVTETIHRVVTCERPVTYVEHYGWEEEEIHKGPHRPEPPKVPCKSCDKPEKDCKCKH
jgi:hypothetical protein